VEYFEQALSALPHLPEQRDTREQAIDLRLALRSALAPIGAYARILACLREAEALDDPRRLAWVSSFLSFDFYRRGFYDQGIAAAQRALVLTTANGEVILHALANRRLGRAYLHQGDYRRAITCHMQTITSLDGARRRERFGQIALPTVHDRAMLAWCHAELGTFAEGRALAGEGLRLAEAVDHPTSLMIASWGIGLLAFTREHQERGNEAYALRLLGDIATHRALPDVDAGATHYRQALALTNELGMRPLQAHCHRSLSTLYATAGQREQARTALATAIEMYRAMDMTFWLPQAEAVLAQVY
jgi:tetratricopeptide (TPR) repeat protein